MEPIFLINCYGTFIDWPPISCISPSRKVISIILGTFGKRRESLVTMSVLREWVICIDDSWKETLLPVDSLNFNPPFYNHAAVCKYYLYFKYFFFKLKIKTYAFFFIEISCHCGNYGDRVTQLKTQHLSKRRMKAQHCIQVFKWLWFQSYRSP